MAIFKSKSMTRRPLVSQVLNLDAPELASADGASDIDDIDALDAAGLVAALESEGISPREDGSDPSEDSMRRALKSIRHADFWRTHWAMHGNGGRVKKWLWVHGRYRDQLDDLLARTDRRKARAAFAKWIKKLKGHSKYEDGMLFRHFMGDPVTSDEVKTKVVALMGDHADHELEGEIANILSSPDGGEWAGQMKSYVENMKDHLLLEERALVGPWLNLDGAGYKNYRSLLSWKYAAIY